RPRMSTSAARPEARATWPGTPRDKLSMLAVESDIGTSVRAPDELRCVHHLAHVCSGQQRHKLHGLHTSRTQPPTDPTTHRKAQHVSQTDCLSSVVVRTVAPAAIM